MSQPIIISVDDLLFLLGRAYGCQTGTCVGIVEKGINVWYGKLTPADAARVYNYIVRNKPVTEADRCLLARFDPKNQYDVEILYGAEKYMRRAFLFGKEYHVGYHTRIHRDYITNVKKVEA